MSTLLDDAFQLLSLATDLEKREGNAIEAATKYYEACYLLKRYLQRMPISSTSDDSNDRTRILLKGKITHYDSLASNLLSRNNSGDNNQSQGIIGSISPITTTSPKATLSLDISSGITPTPSSNFSSSPRFASSRSTNSTATATIISRTGQANARLARALDVDESGDASVAIQEYMIAAELYLDIIKISDQMPRENDAKSSRTSELSISAVLKRRLEGALDRIEELKQGKAGKTGVCQIKKVGDVVQQRPEMPRFTSAEIEVLKRSSVIGSKIVLPWSDVDVRKLVIEVTRASATPWKDPDGFLKLSDKQNKRLLKWARPAEILKLRNANIFSVKQQKEPVMVKAITPYSIRQNFVQDCSFIASLCICAAFERRFQKTLVTSIIYPQNANGRPVLSPTGKYIVKLWLNGVARQVIVDDYFPVDRNGNLLCSRTTTNGLELWVSIIEKAYMKLCGGYDFPGSNSGVDLFSLTGWIPERLFFPEHANKVRDFETPVERAWERLVSANSFGDCLITVSTSDDITETVSKEIGLVTGHAYAVLSVIETKNGTRLLQLKNPWAHKGWKGTYSSHDLISWSDPLFCREVGYDQVQASKHDDGIFWISWKDVLIYFRNLHLSWNPSLFAFRVATHGSWHSTQGPQDDTFNVGENPQYIMTMSDEAVKKKATIWILLSRHVTKQEQEGSEVTDYLTLHMHRNNGKKQRIWYRGGKTSVLTGAYTNNPHVLARYEISGTADKHLSLVLSQFKKSHDLRYTLSCFCTAPFNLDRPIKDLPQCTEVSSEWTSSTAGGPPGTNTFQTNPMWVLRVVLDEGVYIQIRCSANKTAACNILLVPIIGNQDTRLTGITSEPVIDTGPYRHGFVASEAIKKVPKGTYTLVVSSFNPGFCGAFRVQVFSSTKIKLEVVP